VGFFLERKPEDVVIVKIFGSNTEELIDRQAEIETMKILFERKCGAELYATFDNGICYEFMNGSTLEVEDCRREDIFPLVATEMAHMHSSVNVNDKAIKVTVANGGDNAKCAIATNGIATRHRTVKTSPIWARLYSFNKLAEESIKSDNQLKDRLFALGITSQWASGEIERLKTILEEEDMPITFCHNDLIPRNIVYDPKKQRITFIDVEYAMLNYPAFDVANHFLEFAGVPELDYSKCPDMEFRLKWISEYLRNLRLDDCMRKLTVEQFNHWVDLCIPVSHMFWGLWGIHQARHSTIEFDYVEYVTKRFEEYKKCMTELKNPRKI